MRVKDNRGSERGDTIIEVIFAIVILSFVTISSLSIMNRGIATGEKALEITLVRQQVNAQAEALRYIHDTLTASPSNAQLKIWNEFREKYGEAAASNYGPQEGKCVLPSSENGHHPFILNARTATVWTGTLSVLQDPDSSHPPYSQVVYGDDSSIQEVYGIWVESVPSTSSADRPFVDFHIRACWPAPGSDIPMTIGTIVRLYDPVYEM